MVMETNLFFFLVVFEKERENDEEEREREREREIDCKAIMRFAHPKSLNGFA